MEHKKVKYIHVILFLGIILSLLSGCRKDDPLAGVVSPEVLEINTFVKEHMDVYYLWNNFLPDIDHRFQPDPFEYFDTLKYKPTDKWSFITDDYEALKKRYEGVELSFGYSYALYWKDETKNEIIAIVQFVYTNTPASVVGLKRGDMVTKINNETLDKNNYEALLGLTNITLTYSRNEDGNMQDYDGQMVAGEITLNPILQSQVIDLDNKKVGYIAYKNFWSEFNADLTNEFIQLKNQGIEELVLDLRYNNGGYATAKQHLASLIAPKQQIINEDIISTYIYNDILTAQNEKEGNSPHVLFIDAGANLNFSKVYILTGSGSASASEGLITGLVPYMEVVTIGEQTGGKYTSAFLLSDTENHNWAIQPIVSKYQNALGYTDFVDGLAPDYYMEDNLSIALGSKDEPMLAKALELIYGAPVTSAEKSTHSIQKQELLIDSYDGFNPRKDIPDLMKELQ